MAYLAFPLKNYTFNLKIKYQHQLRYTEEYKFAFNSTLSLYVGVHVKCNIYKDKILVMKTPHDTNYFAIPKITTWNISHESLVTQL